MTNEIGAAGWKIPQTLHRLVLLIGVAFSEKTTFLHILLQEFCSNLISPSQHFNSFSNTGNYE